MENRNKTGSDCQNNATNESAEHVGEVETFTSTVSKDRLSKYDDQLAPSQRPSRRSALPVRVTATEEECRHVTVQCTADEKYCDKLLLSNPQNNNEVAMYR